VTSSWFFLSTLNYDARSTTHQIYSILILCTCYKTQKLKNVHIKVSTTIIAPRYVSSEDWQNQRTTNRWPLKWHNDSELLQTIPSNVATIDLITQPLHHSQETCLGVKKSGFSVNVRGNSRRDYHKKHATLRRSDI